MFVGNCIYLCGMFLSDVVFIFVGVVCRKTRPLASTRSCSTKVDRQEMETDETSTKANSNTCRVSLIKKTNFGAAPFLFIESNTLRFVGPLYTGTLHIEPVYIGPYIEPLYIGPLYI